MEDKENSWTVGDDRISDILFTDDQGLGLRFSMKPCPERRQTRVLVQRGGGHMDLKSYHEDCINLTTVDQLANEDQTTGHKWYLMTYVFDCVRDNQLRDLDHYLFAKPLNTSSETDNDSHPLIIDEQISDQNDEEDGTKNQEDGGEEENAEEEPNNAEDNAGDEESILDNSEQESNGSLTDVEESEESSKYFKTKSRGPTPKRAKSDAEGRHDIYLQYMKDNRDLDTPENLRRIKEALIGMASRGTKQNQNNNKESKTCKTGQYSIRTRARQQNTEPKTFGAKIVDKTGRKSNDSTVSGSQVSDISSDEEPSNSAKQQPNIVRVVKAKQTPVKFVAKQSSLYNLTEEEAILEFIVSSQRFDELKGRSLWEEAEKKEVCPGRTWQSMKERFRKHIILNIASYDIEKKYKSIIKNNFYSEGTNRSGAHTPRKSQTGPAFYSTEEDMHIINHVVRISGYELVKGREMWQDMAAEFSRNGVCEGRTWQSLKERYIRRIAPNLFNYSVKIECAQKILSSVSGLTDDAKKLILKKLELKNAMLAPKKNLSQSATKKSTKRRA